MSMAVLSCFDGKITTESQFFVLKSVLIFFSALISKLSFNLKYKVFGQKLFLFRDPNDFTAF